MNQRALLLAAATALVSSGLFAQNTSQSPSSPTSLEDKTVELSPFQVTATDDGSYVASESLSGTRIRAQVKELPFNVNVVTSEFFQDFDKFELEDALAFTSSVSSNDITPSAINLRGFSASSPTRNGMSFFGLTTRSNLDRVEVIKGPYAAIYGKTLPGGLVNIITKRPSPRAQHSLNLTVGSLDYYRAELSLTGPLSEDKKLLYRVDLGHNEKGGTQDFAKSRRSEYSAAVSYQFSERTLALLEVSRMDNYASRQSPVVYLRDPTTNQYIGKLTEMFYFNRSGPSGNNRVHQDWMTDNIYAYVDHRFNDVFSLRVSGVWWERNSPALAAGGGTFVYTNSRDITAQNWSLSDIARDNLQFLADLLAQYKTGTVAHKTLISLTRSEETESTWTRGMSAATLANASLVNRTINLDNPVWKYPDFNDLNAYSVLSRDRSQVTTTEALFVSQRTDVFDSKLKLFAGGRFDKISNLLIDRLTSLQQKTTSEAFTPQFGINYTPVKPVSFYANISKSYLPQSQVRSQTQELYPNEEGEGMEFGVKTTWLDGKLNVVLGAYAIERNNVLQTFFDEDLGMSVTNIDGQIKTDGVELDFNWQLTPALQVIGGFGYMDNRVTKNDESPWVVGQLVARGPSSYNYGMAFVYRFQGTSLNGLSLRADFSGQGESLGEYGGGPYTRAGVTYANDGRINIKQPGYTIFNAGASYIWRGKNKSYRHSVSLNFKNLFDEQYSRGNWIPADGFSYSLTYSIKL